MCFHPNWKGFFCFTNSLKVACPIYARGPVTPKVVYGLLVGHESTAGRPLEAMIKYLL